MWLEHLWQSLVYMYLGFRVILCRLFGKDYLADCGHVTKLFERVTVYGKKIIFFANKHNLKYCIECLSNMSIPCAWCHNPIIVGESVTLYSPSKKEMKIPFLAVKYSDEPLRFVGCMSCADTVADIMGQWVVPGKVKRILSPLEVFAGAEMCKKKHGSNQEMVSLVTIASSSPPSTN